MASLDELLADDDSFCDVEAMEADGTADASFELVGNQSLLDGSYEHCDNEPRDQQEPAGLPTPGGDGASGHVQHATALRGAAPGASGAAGLSIAVEPALDVTLDDIIAGAKAEPGTLKRKNELFSPPVKSSRKPVEGGAAVSDWSFTRAVCTTLEEPKLPLMKRAIDTLGVSVIRDLLDAVAAVEAAGGQMTASGDRRRTPGGVFWALARERISPEDWSIIFAEESQLQKARNNRRKAARRGGRGGGGAGAESVATAGHGRSPAAAGGPPSVWDRLSGGPSPGVGAIDSPEAPARHGGSPPSPSAAPATPAGEPPAPAAPHTWGGIKSFAAVLRSAGPIRRAGSGGLLA